MCRLCGGNVKLLECVFFLRGSLSIVSRFFIDGMCVVAFAHATNTMSGTTFHSPCDNVIDERLVFCGFPMQGFCGKYLIAVCKFISPKPPSLLAS